MTYFLISPNHDVFFWDNDWTVFGTTSLADSVTSVQFVRSSVGDMFELPSDLFNKTPFEKTIMKWKFLELAALSERVISLICGH